ncbi:hypothetical protein FISHEDRAFT_32253 [Fistulina hepatica ATCC 64428]|uniref:Uncharacterized protein n=1 Tax=Fistulina hepatica ATCC 64428 TaxID=1128425 RepID=A0A0D7ARK5_9AGAR|nr:hypothetical protein FISHEDRAFT_32253 [Fistulina hepatica ATCC 64428]
MPALELPVSSPDSRRSSHRRTEFTPSHGYLVNPPLPSTTPSLHPPIHTLNAPWHSQQHLHLFPPNTYISSNAPIPVAHKVWILDCRTCGMFLTNRGMKAVLLLRPNVALYSSDALPVNCSGSVSAPAVKSCMGVPLNPQRTCECLTQTLCCHGCGSPVGYMIVIPCTRCTSSVSANNRATNGHRFVFHSSEIVGTERHYVPDEPGVLQYELVAPQPFIPPVSRHSSEFLPTPPLETLDVSPSASVMDLAEDDDAPPYDLVYDNTSFHNPSSPSARRTRTYSGSPHETYPDTSKEVTPQFRKVKGGELLFWHHLARHGEIPAAHDDPRARSPARAKDPGKIICGR